MSGSKSAKIYIMPLTEEVWIVTLLILTFINALAGRRWVSQTIEKIMIDYPGKKTVSPFYNVRANPIFLFFFHLFCCFCYGYLDLKSTLDSRAHTS